jgi:hypothetical protein
VLAQPLPGVLVMSRPLTVWFLACVNFVGGVFLSVAALRAESLPAIALNGYYAISSLILAINILRLRHVAYLGFLGRVAFLVVFGLVRGFPVLTLGALAAMAHLLRWDVQRLFNEATLAPVAGTNDAFLQFMDEWKNKCLRARGTSTSLRDS